MKWFLNLKTQTKLLGGFSLIVALLVCVGAMGIYGLGKLNFRISNLYDHHFKGVVAILAAEGDMQRVGKALRQSVLETSPEKFDKQAGLVVAGEQQMTSHLDETEPTLQSAEAKASLKRIRELMTTWLSNHQEVLQFVRDGRRDLAVAKLDAGSALSKEMQTEIEKMRDSKLALGEKATVESAALFGQLRATLVLLVVLGAVCGLGLGFVIARMVAQPLARAASVLQSVAAGDFTRSVTVESTDETGQLGQSLNDAIASMRTALQQVHSAAASVAAASKQLSAATDEISSGAQEQASSLEETAASLEEMTSAVKQNADNAAHAAQLAHGAREVAEKGGQVVSTAVTAMDEINTSSRKIADIITAIDEIAFQTNLLALNAAVEAARAGEQGRGFAVVAAEVRNLAQRSASSAKEIKTLIHDSVAKVEAGSKLVNQSGDTLGEIVNSVKRVTDIVGEIAASSREQSTGIEQVNTAVTQMDGVTQANASQTEEMSSTAESLSEQAQSLMDVVRRFKLDEHGVTATHSAAPAVPSRHVAAPRKPLAKALKLVKRAPKAARTAPDPAPVPEPAATGTDGGFEEF